MQSGDQDPMRIRNAGGALSAMMQMTGTEVNFDFSDLGNESVSVAAGEFDARKVKGSGTTESKIIFKTIKVSSDSTVWMSEKVPFGMVKAEGSSVTNGKTSTNATQLLEFGMSGATSRISKEPKDMPNMGNIFGK